MHLPEPDGIVDPHARERALPPLPGCFPPVPRRKGCYDKPPIPDLADLESIILHAARRPGPPPRR